MAEYVGETSRTWRRTSRPRRHAQRASRGGFSFVEILFAVMILGIGFIMIAGIFPVALNQTQANGDETIAASTARQGAAVIASLPNTAALMAADSTVHPFGASGTPGDTTLWGEVAGSQVLVENPRYAWVPFYCRRNDAYGLPANTAQVTIIAARVRNHDAYTLADASSGSSGALVGKPVSVMLTSSTSLATPDLITFVPPSSGTGNIGAAAPGTFVVIAGYGSGFPGAPADPNATPAGSTAVGWVLKVGALAAPPSSAPAGSVTYSLQPGGDTKSSTLYQPSPTTTLTAYIIGQGVDPDSPPTAPTFTGGAQDIMAYTTFVPLH
jgi:hypothetical protein